MAGRMLVDQIEAGGLQEIQVAAGSTIVTDQQLRNETAAAEDAASRGAVQRSIERAVGLSTVEVDLAPDRAYVTICAARPDVAWGFLRAAETEGAWRELAADQLRRELEELTGKRVRLDIRQVPGPQQMPASEESGRSG